MSRTQLWLLASLAFASLASLADGAPPAETSGSQLGKQDTTTIMVPTHVDNCTVQRKGRISGDQRLAKSCERTLTSRTDFVYKVRVDEVTEGFFTDIYTMRVLQVIWEGSLDVDPVNKLRIFLSPPHCRMTLDVQKDKTYLIMGASRDILRNDQSQSYQYVFGGRTWIEYWPTEAECRTPEHRPTCGGIEEMDQMLSIFGCPDQ